MSPEQYASLRTYASQARNVERVLLGIENQVHRFKEDGWPDEALAWSSENIPQLRRVRDRLMRECGRAAKGSPLHAWVSETHGLGPAIFFTAGLIPPLNEFRTVSGLWKYLGLHVADGRSVRRTAGSFVGFNIQLRAYALKRVAEPTIKQTASPYRAVYDERKERTRETHSAMLTEDKKLVHPDCPHCQEAVGRSKKKRAESQQTRERTTVGFDCSNVGGVHWTDGHRHADALRVTAKAIFRDAWRVAHGLEPRTVTANLFAATNSPPPPPSDSLASVGGHSGSAVHSNCAPALASV